MAAPRRLPNWLLTSRAAIGWSAWFGIRLWQWFVAQLQVPEPDDQLDARAKEHAVLKRATREELNLVVAKVAVVQMLRNPTSTVRALNGRHSLIQQTEAAAMDASPTRKPVAAPLQIGPRCRATAMAR
jgi:hypothetical protein